jgi:hypothetical protein
MAKKRFGLLVLSYIVTCNHLQILVRNSGPKVIADSMQLIAGRSGQPKECSLAVAVSEAAGAGHLLRCNRVTAFPYLLSVVEMPAWEVIHRNPL